MQKPLAVFRVKWLDVSVRGEGQVDGWLSQLLEK